MGLKWHNLEVLNMGIFYMILDHNFMSEEMKSKIRAYFHNMGTKITF